jgi:hypothetical protein
VEDEGIGAVAPRRAERDVIILAGALTAIDHF